MSDEFFGASVTPLQVSGAGTSGVESRAPSAGVSTLGLAAEGLGNLLTTGLQAKEVFDRQAIAQETAAVEDQAQTLKLDLESLSQQTGIPASVLSQQNPSARHRLIIESRRNQLNRKYPGYEAEIASAFARVREDAALMGADMMFQAQQAQDKARSAQIQAEISELADAYPALAADLVAGNPQVIQQARQLQDIDARNYASDRQLQEGIRATSVTVIPDLISGLSNRLANTTDPSQVQNVKVAIAQTQASLNSLTAGLTGDELDRAEDMLKGHKDALSSLNDMADNVQNLDQVQLDALKATNALKVEALKNNMPAVTNLFIENPNLMQMYMLYGASEHAKTLLGKVADGITTSIDTQTKTEVERVASQGAAGVLPVQNAANVLNNRATVSEKYQDDSTLKAAVTALNDATNPEMAINGLTQAGMYERVMGSGDAELIDSYYDALSRTKANLERQLDERQLNLIRTEFGYRHADFPDMSMSDASRIRNPSVAPYERQSDRQRAAQQFFNAKEIVEGLNKLENIPEFSSSDEATVAPVRGGTTSDSDSSNLIQVGDVNYRNLFDTLPIPKPVADWLFELTQENTQTTGDFDTDNFVSGLAGREGVGDNVTDVETGAVGMTAETKAGLERKEGRELSDEEAARIYVEEGKQVLQSELPNYGDMPTGVKKAVIDLGYNLGFDRVSNFRGIKTASSNKDWENVLINTLDTANVSDMSLRGLAKRRAEMWNQAGIGSKISEVVQEDDGTIRYMVGSRELFSYTPSGGRHPKSSAGVIAVN